MRQELEEIARIERFLNGELTSQEEADFREEMRLNPAFENEVEKQRLIQDGIQSLFLKQTAVSAYRRFKLVRLFKFVGIPVMVVTTAIIITYVVKYDERPDIKPEPTEQPIVEPTKDTINSVVDSVVNKDTSESEAIKDSIPEKEIDVPKQPKFTGNIDDIIIEAEGYIDYKDLSPENVGNAPSDDAVDLYNFGGPTVVGHTLPEEWLEYSFDIPIDGSYEILVTVGSGQDSVERAVNFSINSKLWKKVNIPFTGSWLDYQTISSGTLNLEKGKQQKLKLDFLTGWINLDKIIIRYAPEKDEA